MRWLRDGTPCVTGLPWRLTIGYSVSAVDADALCLEAELIVALEYAKASIEAVDAQIAFLPKEPQ